MKLVRWKAVIFSGAFLIMTSMFITSHIYSKIIGLLVRSKFQEKGVAINARPLFGNSPVLVTINNETGEKQMMSLQQVFHILTDTNSTSNSASNSIKKEVAFMASQECLLSEDPSPIKTQFKFFIYDLPPKFNSDIINKMTTDKEYSFCYNLKFCGMGEELYRLNSGNVSNDEAPSLSIRNTHMFALEVIMHHKLMRSPYRTLYPDQADMFYIPAYTGLTCRSSHSGATTFVSELFTYLRQNKPHFLSGKPQFSTLSTIQREQGSDFCGTLRHPDSANITYIAIEKESNPCWADPERIYGNKILVAPYPSYIHFIPSSSESQLKEFYPNVNDLVNNIHFRLKVPSLAERKVKLLIASSLRRVNSLRNLIIDQFNTRTDLDFTTYIQKNSVSTSATDNVLISDIMLMTPECSESHRTTTIPWMMHSIFCLQPPGDSPTRKSFYDSILSGCIPIIFNLKYKTDYPFQKWLDYSKFTVTIDEKEVTDKNVLDMIQSIPQRNITALHEQLLRVAKWFQYSMNDIGIQKDTDAVTLILEQLKDMTGVTRKGAIGHI